MLRNGDVMSPYPFHIRRLLGRGGMAETYLADDVNLRTQIVIKTIRDGLRAEPGIVRRFRREIRIVAHLQHQNIIRLLGCNHSDTAPWFAMEYCANGDLETYGASCELSDLAKIFCQACDGVAYAHASGRIHRDLKPSNILIHGDGTARVADFGLALLLDRDSTILTPSGRAVGTPAFMAPEQWRHAKSVKEPADVYSMAATIRHLLQRRNSAPLARRVLKGLTPFLEWDPSARPSLIELRDFVSGVAGS